jgi:transglutaminase-like putative cysteine protease
MYFIIRHATRFNYSAAISESLMEIRKQPRTENHQHCLSFKLVVEPQAAVLAYRDYLGNVVHHFDLPATHQRITVTAESFVEVDEPPTLPYSLPSNAWAALDEEVKHGDFYDWLLPSTYTEPTPLLNQLARELGATSRRDDPLTFIKQLNTGIYHAFDYQPQSTQVDSPIDHALETRRGVCQDFTHVMLTILRTMGVPCRYVSGYLARQTGDKARSVPDASHAWVDVYLPDLGWIGFDPTNNCLAGQRHLRVAIGRDYADVPPTRGVYKGTAISELHLAVDIQATDTLPKTEELVPITNWIVYGTDEKQVLAAQQYAAQQYAAQQQQQQQQQYGSQQQQQYGGQQQQQYGAQQQQYAAKQHSSQQQQQK